jgi:hypothetical protein
MPTTEHRVLVDNILEDEPACEMTHKGTTPCTVTVVARITGACPGRDVNMCETARRSKQKQMDTGKRCVCGARAADCWRIHPI